MSIIKKRYFAMFTEPQCKWLNDMAAKGYRLVRVGKLEYEFEECEPGRYIYEIEYVGDKSFENEKEYKEFLENCGYKVFYKNINLDYSIGKVTWRPFAEKGGRISTKRDTYDKELLIIEKENDGKPFELHSTLADKINYYRRIRNPWLILTACLAILSALFLNAVLAVMTLLCLIPVIRTQAAVHKCRKEAEVTDAGGSVGESVFIKIFVPVALVLTVICLVIGASGCIHTSINSKSGTFLGYAENHFGGVFNVSYSRADGRMTRTLSPRNDAKIISADIVTTSGTISVTIKSENGDILWERPEGAINESFTVPTSGEKVIIYVNFQKSKGSLNFEYR